MKRKMLSRLMAASLAAIMVVGMAGCGDDTTDPSDSTPSNDNSNDNSGNNGDNNGDNPDNNNNEEVGQYTVIKDPATGEAYDLGGVEIIIRDWFSGDPQEPSNSYEEAVQDWRDWIQETYNFTIKQQAISDWGSTPQDFSDYVSTGGDDNWYAFTLRDDVTTTSAMGNGLMWDLTKLDCLDLSEEKFTKNKTLDLYTHNGAVYAMYAGDPEPRTGLYFNKRILTERNINYQDIYEMEKNGTWTWSAWTDLMDKVQAVDDNGDNVPDVWGFNVNNGMLVKCAIFSNGGEIIGKDASGKYVYKVEDPEAVEALNWVAGVFNDYMQLEPEGAQWDYYQQAFMNGEVAFLVEDAYMITGLLADMTDDWGFVVFPKPDGKDIDYTNLYANNLVCIPSCYNEDKAWKIAFAWNLYTADIPGYEDYEGWKPGYKKTARDDETVDLTLAMMVKNGMVSYHGVIPDLNPDPDFFWRAGKNMDVSNILEGIRESWKTLIDEANSRNY